MLRHATISAMIFACGLARAADFPSHPPMRPLPTASDRPAAEGPAFYADAERGDDAADGSQARPWRSIHHALRQLKPGDTLYLRGGRYYEHVVVPFSGTEEQPITMRSHPGELAIIDGGLREFLDHPETAWAPFSGGAPGEYISTKEYPQFAERPILNSFVANGWEPFHGLEDDRPVVQGNFADSMVPLHGYRKLADLRDSSMLWDVENKHDDKASVYCGPGLWYDRRTYRIHIRLAHTNLDGLGDGNYRGETDPRKTPLVISGPCGADVLRINGIANFRLQDVVLCGASGSPLVNLFGSKQIAFDGVTFYGGWPSLMVKSTTGMKVEHCAFRSLAAPWSSRASMKYRGTPSYVIISDANQPENDGIEIAFNEFTDGHDLIYGRFLNNFAFHHNYIDNFNDDGLEVGAKKTIHHIRVYQNLFSRCLIHISLHEMAPDESPAVVAPEVGVYLTRNIFDLRRGTFKSPPKEPDPSGASLNEPGMLCSDHGGPIWPNYFFYHNTVVRADKSFRGYYGFGMGGQGTRATRRLVYNNIFVQLNDVPGLNFLPGFDDVRVDGNLHWGVAAGPGYQGDFFQLNQAAMFKKTPQPAGWMAHDLFADPKFAKLGLDPAAAFDLALPADSPAVDSGIEIPSEWPDPLRADDAGKPDLGALPAGVAPWRIGVRGRLTAFGESTK